MSVNPSREISEAMEAVCRAAFRVQAAKFGTQEYSQAWLALDRTLVTLASLDGWPISVLGLDTRA